MSEPAPCDPLYEGPSLNSILACWLPQELAAPPLDEIDCNGFLSQDDLQSLVAMLGGRLSGRADGQGRLLDLGCGSGGLARFLATRLGCATIGIDRSARAIALARAAPTAASNAIEFRTADFKTTGLADRCIEAIISLDALYLAAEPHAALSEARRVVSSGGTLIFTTYATLGKRDLRPEEWCALAHSVGWTVVACRDQTQAWRSMMRRKHEARWNSNQDIHRLLGDRATPELQVSAAMLGVGRSSFIDATERYAIELRRDI